MLTPIEYKDIYHMLDEISPVPFDCGPICGEACCRNVTEEDGIHLLPGEEHIHRDDEWSHIEKIEDRYFVKCKGPENCNRPMRPIQCRTFPLMPALDKKGELVMRLNDMELPFSCPLIDAETGLNDDFIQKTTDAWKILVQDEDIRKSIL